MKKFGIFLGLATALLLWSFWVSFTSIKAEIVGPINTIACNQIANLPVGSTTITQVIAAKTGQQINICGWHVTNTGATGTYSLSYGTGSNCGTGTTTITPTTNVTSTAPDTDHIEFAMYSLPASAALCVTSSVNTVSTLIFYSFTGL